MSDESLIEAMHDDIYRLLIRLGIDDLTALRESGALCEDLQRRFGARDHYVPAIDKTTRNARIAADLASGLSAAAIAEKHGVHPNTVRRIRARTRPRDSLGFGSADWVL